MRRIIHYTEQLQLAGKFLSEKSHQLARLSLILCDNSVELLAHERCRYQLLIADDWISTPRLSTSDRRAVRGRKFNPKLNLLVRLGDMSEDERDLATCAHLLRNECYHSSEMHEQIAWRVAWEYHELACTLFDRWRSWGYILGGSVHRSQETSKILETAGYSDDVMCDPENTLDALISILRKTKPSADAPLGTVLAEAGERRFKDLIDSIDFIAHDGLQTDSRDNAIREVYFAATLDVDALKENLPSDQQEAFLEFQERREREHAKYNAPFRFRRVERWLRRASALASENSATLAMTKYMDLLRESRDAKTIIDDAAFDLDKHIQLQTDIARGK